MVNDLNIPIEIIQCPIVREESGLALSSRNKYLSEEGKNDALVLSKILNNIKTCYKKGVTDVSALKETAYSFLTDNHELEVHPYKMDIFNLSRKPGGKYPEIGKVMTSAFEMRKNYQDIISKGDLSKFNEYKQEFPL